MGVWNSKEVIFDLSLVLRWILLVRLMDCCREAAGHCLNQRWPSSMTPYVVIKPQWVNGNWILNDRILYLSKESNTVRTWYMQFYFLFHFMQLKRLSQARRLRKHRHPIFETASYPTWNIHYYIPIFLSRDSLSRFVHDMMFTRCAISSLSLALHFDATISQYQVPYYGFSCLEKWRIL